MLPLKRQLSPRGRHLEPRPERSDFAAIERVPPRRGLNQDRPKISIDRAEWQSLRAKALELRMVAIAPGLSSEDCASKQAFAPERDQAPGVEILGMNGPESHSVATNGEVEVEGRGRGDGWLPRGRQTEESALIVT